MKANYQNLKCCFCGKKFTPGNTNGMPNGVGFQMKSEKIYNVCRECITYRHEGAVKFINESEKEHI